MSSDNGFVKHVIHGWQWTGIGQYQTGNPLTVTSGRDISLSGIGRHRAVLTGAPLDAPGGADKRVWFNKDAFSRDYPEGTFGTTGAGILTGPQIYSFDMGIFKHFTITERVSMQFRSEFFNIFNQTNFANPTTNFSSGRFGRIGGTQSYAGEPRVIQFGLKLAF